MHPDQKASALRSLLALCSSKLQNQSKFLAPSARSGALALLPQYPDYLLVGVSTFLRVLIETLLIETPAEPL